MTKAGPIRLFWPLAFTGTVTSTSTTRQHALMAGDLSTEETSLFGLSTAEQNRATKRLQHDVVFQLECSVC